jgi:hypothetical protein
MVRVHSRLPKLVGKSSTWRALTVGTRCFFLVGTKKSSQKVQASADPADLGRRAPADLVVFVVRLGDTVAAARAHPDAAERHRQRRPHPGSGRGDDCAQCRHLPLCRDRLTGRDPQPGWPACHRRRCWQWRPSHGRFLRRRWPCDRFAGQAEQVMAKLAAMPAPADLHAWVTAGGHRPACCCDAGWAALHALHLTHIKPAAAAPA